ASGSVTQRFPSIPVVMLPVFDDEPGRPYSTIFPLSVMAPTACCPSLSSVNHTRPSGPAASHAGRCWSENGGAGIPYRLILVPFFEILSTVPFASWSATPSSSTAHSLASGPTVMPMPKQAHGNSWWLITSPFLVRCETSFSTSCPAPESTHQMSPLGATVMPV